MQLSNRSSGTRFENELCEILFRHDFWAHNIAQNKSGQPADVIAVRKDKPYLIDCKVCEHDKFPLSRIESNQELAMNLWKNVGNTECYFALKDHSGAIYMAHFNTLIYLKDEKKTKEIKDLEVFPTLEEWICGQL